ncbi:MAG: response regulator transcription factor [Anaerolineales bacterium]|nr:MAG: response regulator transcription factor [Anaerolineales bacterium]
MARKLSQASKTKILWVEGRWVSNGEFVPALLKKGFQVQRVSSGKDALESVSEAKHDLVILDAASMRTNGRRICTSIRNRVNGMPILLISDPNRPLEPDFECANEVLVLPFTQRKLLNRIAPLLPTAEGRLLKAGPIELDQDSHAVKVGTKKTVLTPRLVKLLQLLIESKGEVVERNTLFKKAWKTNYTGDTRTLDVHISWLRNAIEKDPKKPKLLVTVRGVGYRLDI